MEKIESVTELDSNHQEFIDGFNNAISKHEFATLHKFILSLKKKHGNSKIIEGVEDIIIKLKNKECTLYDFFYNGNISKFNLSNSTLFMDNILAGNKLLNNKKSSVKKLEFFNTIYKMDSTEQECKYLLLKSLHEIWQPNTTYQNIISKLHLRTFLTGISMLIVARSDNEALEQQELSQMEVVWLLNWVDSTVAAVMVDFSKMIQDFKLENFTHAKNFKITKPKENSNSLNVEITQDTSIIKMHPDNIDETVKILKEMLEEDNNEIAPTVH